MIKKDSKQRLFEVMGHLDKTFKPKLNEGFEEIEATDSIEAPMGGEETQEPQEKTPEEKLQELTAKVDELYALLHGEEEGEEETGEESAENLQEWNFDKKKGEKKEEKGEKKESGKKKWNFEKEEGKESLEHEEGESHEEEEKEHEEKKELKEAKPKIPVAAIAKVGK
jgi:hypothetical protein